MKLGLLSLALAALVGSGAVLPAIHEEISVSPSTAVKMRLDDPESSSGEESAESVPEEPAEEAEAKIICTVYHVEEETGEKVEDSKNKYGDVVFSSLEGKEGDEIIAVVQANPVMETDSTKVRLYKYVIKGFYVNGVSIVASNYEKGEYTFALAKGANVVSVEFSGRTELSVMDLASMNWRSLLTIDNLIQLIVLAALVFVSSGFFLTLIKKGKIESKTAEEFSEKGLNAMKGIANSVVKDFLENDVKELLGKQTALSQEAVETAQVLMRVTLLAQENTPEARMEIIKELQKYKSTDQELAAQIQAIVDNAIKVRDAAKENLAKALEEAETTVEALDSKEEPEEEDSGFGSL